jgi:hypothetical protein
MPLKEKPSVTQDQVMYVTENSVIHIERLEKSVIHIDRAAENMKNHPNTVTLKG